jgi:hypothetical protein
MEVAAQVTTTSCHYIVVNNFGLQRYPSQVLSLSHMTEGFISSVYDHQRLFQTETRAQKRKVEHLWQFPTKRNSE